MHLQEWETIILNTVEFSEDSEDLAECVLCTEKEDVFILNADGLEDGLVQKSWDISSEVQKSAQSGERDLCAEPLAEIEADSLINNFKEPTEPAPIATEVKADSEEQESWGDLEEAVLIASPIKEEIEDGLDALEEGW